MKKLSTKTITLVAVFVLIALVAAVFAKEPSVPGAVGPETAAEKKAEVASNSGFVAQKKDVDPLPTVDTAEKFAQLMEERFGREGFNRGWGEMIVLEDAEWSFRESDQTVPALPDRAGAANAGRVRAVLPASEEALGMVPSSSHEMQYSEVGVTADVADYSSTNIQVEGVDEADVIKTDGEYIYFANRDKIWIVKASPADDMKVVSTIDFPAARGWGFGFQPTEMYVDGDRLIIIGGAWREYRVNGVPNYQSMTRASVYDISDRANPKKLREVESEGDYLSSRKIGNSVYMISSSWIHQIMPMGIYPMPQFRDTTISEEYQDVGFDRMYYFPNFETNNYLFITGFEVDKPEQAVKIDTYLGAGQTVYASTENMYIATTEYARIQPRRETVEPIFNAGDSSINASPPIWHHVSAPITSIYKFALDSGSVTYGGKQTVPGRILNQFSMDEYDGYFRIATTTHDDNYIEINGLYVLDEDLEIVGKIDDIAPDERIYSARFMGNRAYMVTFKLVDPLFVIDLSDPTEPTVLGALKIPGYSDYLHPYDENHLIGFGKDTIEEKGVALDQGMKLSLFDVTDVTDPKEKFVVSIGDRGTDSPLLRNHRALLFDPGRNLLAFPISVAELSERQRNSRHEYAAWEYGEFKFQGAYVYSLDLENGFEFRGGITHMSEQDMLRSGMYSWNHDKAVERIIRIGENLFTASGEMIKSTAISSLKDIGSVKLQ